MSDKQPEEFRKTLNPRSLGFYTQRTGEHAKPPAPETYDGALIKDEGKKADTAKPKDDSKPA